MICIGKLVGLNSNQRGLGLVDGLVQLLRGHAGHLLGEDLLHYGQDQGCIGTAAAHHVLVKTTLALVQAHGHTALQKGVIVGRVAAQLIQGMAALVDHRVHGVSNPIGVIMSGQTHILGVKTGGEGMLCFRNAAVSGVDAQGLHQTIGKSALRLHLEVSPQEGIIQLLGLADGLDHRHQLLPQGGKKLIQRGHGQALFVLIQQRVIGLNVRIIIARKLAVELHDLFQHRRKRSKIIIGLGLLPHAVRFVQQQLIGNVLILGDATGLLTALL